MRSKFTNFSHGFSTSERRPSTSNPCQVRWGPRSHHHNQNRQLLDPPHVHENCSRGLDEFPGPRRDRGLGALGVSSASRARCDHRRAFERAEWSSVECAMESGLDGLVWIWVGKCLPNDLQMEENTDLVDLLAGSMSWNKGLRGPHLSRILVARA